MVEALVELDYNSFQVGVSGVINEILELVKVVVNHLLALEIDRTLIVAASESKPFQWLGLH